MAPNTIAAATEAGIEELRAEGVGVLDLGEADDRLGDGVSPVRHLLTIHATEIDEFLELHNTLSARPPTVPIRVSIGGTDDDQA
jgi:hypothetical protein